MGNVDVMHAVHVVFVSLLFVAWLLLTLKHQDKNAELIGGIVKDLVETHLNCSEL